MKRADWIRPLLELLEGQALRAGQTGLSSGQKALAAHLFDIIINEVSKQCAFVVAHQDLRTDCRPQGMRHMQCAPLLHPCNLDLQHNYVYAWLTLWA